MRPEVTGGCGPGVRAGAARASRRRSSSRDTVASVSSPATGPSGRRSIATTRSRSPAASRDPWRHPMPCPVRSPAPSRDRRPRSARARRHGVDRRRRRARTPVRSAPDRSRARADRPVDRACRGTGVPELLDPGATHRRAGERRASSCIRPHCRAACRSIRPASRDRRLRRSVRLRHPTSSLLAAQCSGVSAGAGVVAALGSAPAAISSFTMSGPFGK